jgi:hypothetical protein
MITYRATEKDGGSNRAHPWTTAESNERNRYVDFRVYPELIRTSIEDLVEFHGHTFCDKIYSTIEWINGPSSTLESNDLAFRGPRKNIDEQFKYTLRSDGRLMILYRNLMDNCQPVAIEWLMSTLMSHIMEYDDKFTKGAIGLSKSNTIFRELGTTPTNGGKGEQVMLSFFAYGASGDECLDSMEVVVSGMNHALRMTEQRICSGEVDGLFG